ncbi:hypothetical protein B484DRAFT_450718 [Ochromonadaceae sp. CCMP2298]|nr:hypothetical protein B484DRAFT_450718 [Ochromonadaceae sp. CCMP2298]
MEEEEKLAKMMKKRGFVVKEIISTERTYVDRLRSTMSVLIEPLKEAKILDANDIKEQFQIFEHITAVHSQHHCEDFETSAAFVAFFDDIFEHVELYAEYLAAYEPAMQRRGYLLTSNRRFSDFVDKSEKDLGLQGQKLESILILPVQRIPRYRLLLEELRKCTPLGHAQYATVQAALDKISDMAAYSNEAVRARENRSKIMEIMMTIESRSRIDLLSDSDRRFVKEGKLLRQCRRGLKEFQFWLFTDQLLYGQATPIGLYILNRQIVLSKCHVGSFKVESGFSFLVQSPAKSFIICARNEGEKEDWLENIQAAIVKVAEKAGSREVVVGEHAPLWKPDAQVSQCKSCTASFSLLLRRHHCRNCGFIVCDNCSKGRFKLEHVDKDKDVRVCAACFNFLSTEGQRVSVRNQRILTKTNSGQEELYISDEEADEEVRDRDNIDENDLEDFNDFMRLKDVSMAAQLHRQLSRLSSVSSGTATEHAGTGTGMGAGKSPSRSGSNSPKPDKTDKDKSDKDEPRKQKVVVLNPLSGQPRMEVDRDEFGMTTGMGKESPFASPYATPLSGRSRSASPSASVSAMSASLSMSSPKMAKPDKKPDNMDRPPKPLKHRTPPPPPSVSPLPRSVSEGPSKWGVGGVGGETEGVRTVVPTKHETIPEREERREKGDFSVSASAPPSAPAPGPPAYASAPAPTPILNSAWPPSVQRLLRRTISAPVPAPATASAPASAPAPVSPVSASASAVHRLLGNLFLKKEETEGAEETAEQREHPDGIADVDSSNLDS